MEQITSSPFAMPAPSIPDALMSKSPAVWSTEELHEFLVQNKEQRDLIDKTIENLDGINGRDFVRLDVEMIRLYDLVPVQASRIIMLKKDLLMAEASPPVPIKHPKHSPHTGRHGGNGGTIYMGEPLRGISYEGIDLSNSDICLRERTIESLEKKMDSVGALLVRAPPMSGKTSLSQLLEQHLLKDPKIRVFRISILWMGFPSESWTFEEKFYRLMRRTWKNFREECNDIKTVLIVDEAQMLYSANDDPERNAFHGGDSFWNVFKLAQQGGNLRIVCFAAYGYNLASSSGAAITPFNIFSKNCWSFEDVRFTSAEFEDFVSRFCKSHLRLEEDDSKLLQEYVANTTGYHPGLVAYFMDKIQNHFSSDMKYGKKLTFERIFCYLKSYGFYTTVNETRACKALYYLSSEELKLCDKIFHRPLRALSWSDKNVASRLFKTGILSEQKEEVDFTAPYLRALYLQYRYGSINRAKNPPGDIKTFLKGIFTILDANTIRNLYSVGTDGRILERLWQIEFYRAATSLLPDDVYISADVGAKWGSRRYLDFWVDDNPCWAIELLRDGLDASGHKNRFEDDGIYARIKKSAKEWVLIDIRNPRPLNKPPVHTGGNWVNVYCQENWDSVIIDDGKERTNVSLLGGLR